MPPVCNAQFSRGRFLSRPLLPTPALAARVYLASHRRGRQAHRSHCYVSLLRDPSAPPGRLDRMPATCCLFLFSLRAAGTARRGYPSAVCTVCALVRQAQSSYLGRIVQRFDGSSWPKAQRPLPVKRRAVGSQLKAPLGVSSFFLSLMETPRGETPRGLPSAHATGTTLGAPWRAFGGLWRGRGPLNS